MTSKKYHNFGIKLIALVEIIGGLVGIGVTLFYGLQSELNILLMVINIVFIGLYVYSLLAGIWLWRQQHKGLINSIILQSLQIPVIAIPYFTYEFFSGLSFKLGIEFGTTMNIALNYAFELGSRWGFTLLPGASNIGLNINVIALLFLMSLLKLKDEIELHH